MGLFGFFKRKKRQPVKEFLERRIIPRWKINARAKLKWEGRDDYLECRIRDLNLKGFAVSLSQRLPGQCTKMTLNFNDRFLFPIEVAVIWSTEEEGKIVYGLRFTRVRDADRETMYQMVHHDFPEALK